MGSLGVIVGMFLSRLFGGDVPAWFWAIWAMFTAVCALWVWDDWRKQRRR